MWLTHVCSKSYVESCRLLLFVIELQMFACVADHESVAATVDRHASDALRLLFIFECHQFDRRRPLAVPFPESEFRPLPAFMHAGDDQEALQFGVVGNVAHGLAAELMNDHLRLIDLQIFTREFPAWIAQFEWHEGSLSPRTSDLRPAQSNQQSLIVRVPGKAFDVQPALPPVRRSAGRDRRHILKEERTEIGDDFGLAPKRSRLGIDLETYDRVLRAAVRVRLRGDQIEK